MRPRFLAGWLCFVFLAYLLWPEPAWAMPGAVDYFDFAYGVRLYPGAPQTPQCLRLAAYSRLDYVALDLDWAEAEPAPGQWDAGNAFMHTIQLARSLGQPVLVSVRHAPAWALTAEGPAAEAVAQLVLRLAREYPNLAAVELFPGANTAAGWGAAPNAGMYVAVFNAVRVRLQAEGSAVQLVAAGLSNTTSTVEDWRDVDFLQALYSAGLDTEIVSFWLTTVAGQPADAPADGNLRHYEDLRAVMVANGQRTDLLWLTSLTAPASAQWLEGAYDQMFTQLYLGAIFFDSSSRLSDSDPAGCLVPYHENGSVTLAQPGAVTGRVKLMVRK